MDHLDETTIALFVERRLSDERFRIVEHHMDGCAECRELVAAVGRSTPRVAEGSGVALAPGVLERGARIGRYVVLDRVGAGAMGAVYAAFDPDLDRKVAVKLLHRTHESARLLREAQALARVSHPGVVAVHDVGTVDGQVFIAMELVSGGTFRAWLREAPRAWREIVACGVQVARGLAAAHAAGLVHRDVKPDNILVDAHGAARIGDFGLAAMAPAQRPSDPLVQASAVRVDATAANAFVGTPAYMAPEQLAGEPATPRSDQFGFCATLYEALFGVRPYPGTSVDEIVRRMQERRIAEPAADHRVPKRVRAAIVRGLEVEPAARFASMDELAAALVHDPWSRRRIAIVVGGAAVLAGAVVFVFARGDDGPPRCTAAPAEIARVLTPEKRARVSAAIAATKLPFATDTAKRVTAAFDAYETKWIAEHTRACEATAVHGTQSEAMLDKRMSCLSRGLVELDVALETLAATDRQRVRHAVDVATTVMSPAACADPDRLVAAPPPANATTIAEVSRDAARAHALLQVAQVDKSVELARAVVDRAEPLAYPPLLAEAYDIRGQAALAAGDMRLARDSFEKAVTAAAAARDAELEARSLVNLALVLRDTSADGKVAVEHAKHALAVVQRGTRDPALEAQIRYALIRVLAGIDLTQVMEHFTRGRELLAQATGRDTRTLRLEYDIIEAKLDINPNSGIEKYEKALPLAEEVYGKDHPQVAAVLVEMANLGVIAERFDDVRAWSKRIAAILEPYPGDKLELRRIDAALERDPKKRRAIQEEIVRAQSDTPRSMQLAMDREKLAETLLELEAWKDGLVQIDAAIATWEALYGGQFEAMITSLVTKAQLHAGLEQWDAVSAAAERANAIVDKGGMRELVKVMARLILMESYFRQKRFEEALALIEQAGPTVRMALFGDPVTKLLDFYAAACEWELGRDRPGALKRAKDALAIVKTSEAADDATLAPLRDWLRGK